MRKTIENKTYDCERALYNLINTDVRKCTFAGPADGESALKECSGIKVQDCSFSLRYPLWHAENFSLENSVLDEKTRAPLWYCSNGKISGCTIDGVKTLRECGGITVENCSVRSPEFGWRCNEVKILNSSIESEYFLFECKNITADKLKMSGKYSFQYVENAELKNCNLNTKDAFWHCKNITVKNSVIKGEYLAWYSDGLTLINCEIIGTQPLCYCKNLKLVNCTMRECDRAFEYSDVDADVIGHIDSVENPRSGKIVADSIGEVILRNAAVNCSAVVKTRKKNAV